MTETKKYCYCDVLSQHNGQRVAGATTYKDIIVMKAGEDGESFFATKASVDMCSECYKKYRSNLIMNYDLRGRTTLLFQADETEEEPNETNG